MRNKKLVLLGITTIAVAAAIMPCQADAKASGSSKQSSNWTSFPKKTIGFCIGSIVGIPVCCVRKPIDEEKYGVGQMTHDSDDARVKIPAKIFYFPMAAASGILEAPFSSVKNSWQNRDEPFSKAQFSLGEEKPAPQTPPSNWDRDSK
ncbi:MAG: hypothetical protein K2X81_23910 [Candidatus Obscuribacterales bacterium]|nr:hypothetical protein [Candidatus Obscuribacterales bacterium]